jgi:hypothetical protein
MYVSMQTIGNALSGGNGWNAENGQAASYTLNVTAGNSFLDWKPDMSICPGSGGLLLSTMIHEKRSQHYDQEGSLMLWFDSGAKLESAELCYRDSVYGDSGVTGLVTGATPEAIGAEIQRRTPVKEPYFHLGAAANYSVVKLASGVYHRCKIISRKSDKALDIQGGSLLNGAKLIQWTYNGADNQQWRLVPVSPDSYIIISVKSSKVLDVPGHSMNNGTEIAQYTYNGGANQHWRLVEIGNNDYKIESVESGKVLDVLNASMDDGAPVQQYGYGQAPNQRWRIDGL